MRQVFVSASSVWSLLVCTQALGDQARAVLETRQRPIIQTLTSRLIRKERCNDGETGISVNWICVIYVCRGRFWLHLAVVRGR